MCSEYFPGIMLWVSNADLKILLDAFLFGNTYVLTSMIALNR